MRPRHHTAENNARIDSDRTTSAGFNEAAASHRGKRAAVRNCYDDQTGFNEAAASHRGKQDKDGQAAVMKPASMRPRHHTAENYCLISQPSAIGLLQ